MTPDSVHEKLKTLWDQLMKMNPAQVNQRKAVILLDLDSTHMLWNESRHIRDGSFDPMRHNEWRDMTIETVSVAPRARFVGSSEFSEEEIVREPVCVSLRVTKDNGRIVYIDHPDTDEVYKWAGWLR